MGEVAGYKGPDATAPSMEEMNKLIVEEVVKKTLSEILLKNGKPALTLYGDFTHLHINPSGSSSLAAHRAMQASRAARSSSTPMVAGGPTVEVPSQARTLPRLTGPLPTSAGRWRSRP